MAHPALDPIPLPRDRDHVLRPVREVPRLLREEPVRKVRFPNGIDAWLVSRYEYFCAVTSDPARFSSRKDETEPQKRQISRPPVNQPAAFNRSDGEQHRHYRRKLTKEFMVKRIAEMRPHIQRIVDEHLDDVARHSTPVDLVSTFTLPVPSLVIAELLGVPYGHRQAFQDAASTSMSLHATAADVQQSFAKLGEILGRVFDARSSDPREDLISRLLHEQRDLDREELTILCIGLLIAGHETTANFAGLAIATLLQQPDQLAKFTAHPERAGQSVEELLRCLIGIEGGGGLIRRAVEDVEIGGQLIRAGEWVAASMAAANLDPALCPHADQLDLDRAPVAHVSFGYGPHACLGQNLARAELEIMLVSLFSRFPDLRLAVPVEDLPFRDDMLVYGVRALPVTWGARNGEAPVTTG
ncbi:cytochrome P450 [Streptomyces sp. NPDC048637]|uniref:cytochrome P450 n=1 Tax=Streptomyces sp. NPDC048637 TaxID=3155636 RepID=UPI00341ACC41